MNYQDKDNIGRTTDVTIQVDNDGESVVGLLDNSKDLLMVDEFLLSNEDSDNDTFSYSSNESTNVSNDTSNVYSSFLNSDNSNAISMYSSDSSSLNNNNAFLLPIIQGEINILNNVARSIPELISFSKYVNQEQKKWGGSPPGKKGNKDRNFSSAYERIMQDYFVGENSTYNEQDFDRRFRLPRNVFDKIYNRVLGKSLFVQRRDAAKKLGIHPLCRFVACIRYLAYGVSFDFLDEYCRMSESSVHKSVKDLMKIIIDEFGEEYMNRSPTEEESDSILQFNEQRGFPGMFASWDCTHYNWKKCPVALHGQFKGRKECKTIVLEAVVDCDLRFWYVNFGRPGSLSDLNVLHQSSIVRKLLSHDFRLKTKNYTINNTVRDYMYFLVD